MWNKLKDNAADILMFFLFMFIGYLAILLMILLAHDVYLEIVKGYSCG